MERFSAFIAEEENEMKLNLPTKITLIRIALIPIMVIVYYLSMIPYRSLIAGIIFVVAAGTDFLDGYLARKNNQVTNLGKFLDPIADKVLIMTALFLLVESHTIPVIFGAVSGIIILARELIVTGFRQIAAANQVVIAADMTGKVKAVFQDIALCVFLPAGRSSSRCRFHGHICLDLLHSARNRGGADHVSGVNYIVRNKQVLSDPQ